MKSSSATMHAVIADSHKGAIQKYNFYFSLCTFRFKVTAPPQRATEEVKEFRGSMSIYGGV